MCTIAACTSFPEPFVTPPGQKRLSYTHKKFAGHRASDHIAMLNAFYQWERARWAGSSVCECVGVGEWVCMRGGGMGWV